MWQKTEGQWLVAQAQSQVQWPGKTQARAKAGESGLLKLKPGPQATLGHPLGSGLAWLLTAGFGWLSAHGPGREITSHVAYQKDYSRPSQEANEFTRPRYFL